MMFRRTTLSLAALTVLLTAGVSMAGVGYTFITNSAHDFSKGGSAAWSDTQICKPCHTPHSAKQEVSTRLWAHAITTGNPYSTVSLSSGTAVTTSGIGVDTLDNVSRLCMGCHDGQVALADYIGAPAGVGNGKIGAGAEGGAYLGTNLSNDHPVGKRAKYSVQTATTSGGSTTYTFTAARSSLKDAGRYVGASGRTVTGVGAENVSANLATLPLVALYDATQNLPATDTQLVVGCTTCHNPHGTNLQGAGSTAYPKLLRGSNVNSQLCLTCHNK